ncbi:hypothetical protein D9M68_473110 [compost metagenome]
MLSDLAIQRADGLVAVGKQQDLFPVGSSSASLQGIAHDEINRLGPGVFCRHVQQAAIHHHVQGVRAALFYRPLEPGLGDGAIGRV